MIKIFISQPMNGKTNEEIALERNEAKQDMEALFHQPIEVADTWFKEFDVHNPIYYLGKAIQRMDDVDYIYFYKNWENSRGCKIEKAIAELYKIPTIEYNSIKDLIEFLKKY